MRIVLVIPTYNEKENISKLIHALLAEFSKIPKHQFLILVVDGNSPDGTGVVVKDLASKYPGVYLLLETEKKGLGAAYTYGFDYAINKLQADVLVEMDADFQHNPADVVRLVAKIDEGYDYVIGSRFTRGGSIPKEWALNRKFLSIGGNLFSKVVLGIFTINDFTSGFKASRVCGFVDKIDLSQILSAGFAYKIDLLFKMHQLGAKVCEVPITFGMRDRGDSKMEKNNFMDSLKVVLWLRYNASKSFFRFVAVGLVGLVTDTLGFNFLRLFFTNGSASLLSGFVAMFVTFMLNNAWSFSHSKIGSIASVLKKLPVYYFFSYIPIIFRSWLIAYAASVLGDNFVVTNVAFFVGITVGLIWNFTVYSKIIWKRP